MQPTNTTLKGNYLWGHCLIPRLVFMLAKNRKHRCLL